MQISVRYFRDFNSFLTFVEFLVQGLSDGAMWPMTTSLPPIPVIECRGSRLPTTLFAGGCRWRAPWSPRIAIDTPWMLTVHATAHRAAAGFKSLGLWLATSPWSQFVMFTHLWFQAALYGKRQPFHFWSAPASSHLCSNSVIPHFWDKYEIILIFIDFFHDVNDRTM